MQGTASGVSVNNDTNKNVTSNTIGSQITDYYKKHPMLSRNNNNNNKGKTMPSKESDLIEFIKNSSNNELNNGDVFTSQCSSSSSLSNDTNMDDTRTSKKSKPNDDYEIFDTIKSAASTKRTTRSSK